MSAWQSTGLESSDAQTGGSPPAGPPRRSFRSRRAVILLVVVILVLFSFRPGVYHLRIRIASSIGNALGRRVEINNVRLRLLPRPGFELEGLVIYDDPSFSAEPMIRAEEVTAAIRLRSLLRGRLEIANLSANEPSINLVRNQQNHWNLAALIERNAQIEAAPTAKTASERRPAFPYLEATGARINFKIGETKKSYALTDATVALWQDSENSWGARLRAQPVRTDFNLTDTGLIQINANWQRASSLLETPIEITAQWKNGQLGQITKLISGRDRGWRGGVSLTANASGTPEALRIESHIAIGGFHRYDIVNSDNLSLATDCSATYNVVSAALADLLCQSPIGDGSLSLRGEASFAPQLFGYNLTVQAAKVPLSSALRLLRQAKAQIPDGLSATGLLDVEFHGANHASRPAHTDSQSANIQSRNSSAKLGTNVPLWSGSGAASDVHLLSRSGSLGSTRDDISLGTIPLKIGSGANVVAREAPPQGAKSDATRGAGSIQIIAGPTTLTLNSGQALRVGGSVSTQGYSFFLRGNADLEDLARLQTALAIPGALPGTRGSAILDLAISGLWKGFAAPTTTGTALLHNVRANIRGVNAPVEISSANIILTPDEAELQKLSAVIGTTHWTGNLTAPRHCDMSNTAEGIGHGSEVKNVSTITRDCSYQFDLNADRLSSADLASWLIPKTAERPWYSILNSKPNSGVERSSLRNFEAQGKLRIGQFDLNMLNMSQVAASVEISRGKVTLSGLKARLLQGTHQGNWVIDAAIRPDASHESLAQAIAFHGDGTFTDISLSQLSALRNDHWIDGKADASFEIEGSTNSLHDALAKSEAKAHFTVRNGLLPRIELPGASTPLPVHRSTGDLHLQKGVCEFSATTLESRDGLYRVSGKASLTRDLDLTLTRGDDQTFTITGTMAKPIVSAGTRTVAKSNSAKRDLKSDPTNNQKTTAQDAKR